MFLSHHCKEVNDHICDHSMCYITFPIISESQFLANQVHGFIVEKMKRARYCTVLADETKDISKVEQLFIALQYND